MKCSIANPNIAPYIKESVLAYQENNILDQFYTTFFEHKDYPLTKTLIKVFPGLAREIKRRGINEINYLNVKGKPFRELIRVLSARKLSPITTDKIWEWSELDFDRWVASQLRPGLDSIHTYEHAALYTLQRAKRLGITSFYEQPSQHHAFFTKIIHEQIRRYPEFKTEAIGLLSDEKSVRRNDRRDQELQVCDFIFCNSSFTRNSLKAAGIAEEKIVTIPYGFPEVERNAHIPSAGDKVIFMNAGNHNLRKGIHLLYEAWKQCNFGEKAELWMVGKNHLPEFFLKDLPLNIKFIPNIPRTELMELYSKTNVFVLPTLADGFGMVISEAMSKGIPVITTTHSGGPDIIEHEKSGLLIKPDDIEAISNSLTWCVDNKHRLSEMGRIAYEKAASYPWSAFRKHIVASVKEKISLVK